MFPISLVNFMSKTYSTRRRVSKCPQRLECMQLSSIFPTDVVKPLSAVCGLAVNINTVTNHISHKLLYCTFVILAPVKLRPFSSPSSACVEAGT